MLNAELDFHRSENLFLKKLISETDFHAALTKQEVTNFEVRIAVLTPDRQIRPGMSVNVVIDTLTVQQAVSIRIQAVTVRSKATGKTKEEMAQDRRRDQAGATETDAEKRDRKKLVR